MKADAKTEAAVMSIINRLFEAYISRDIDSVLSCHAPDPDVVAIGTGADEKSLGLDELRTLWEGDLAQSEAISYEFGWSRVSAAGSVAWVAGDGIFHGKIRGQEISCPARFTAVLEQREGRWFIMQTHFSIPASEQA